MNKRLAKFLVTGLGAGYLRPAPGTWGSLGAACVFVGVAWACGENPICLNVAMFAIAVAASVICVALGRFAEEAFGCKDPSQVTIDEWAGQAVALLFLPLSGCGFECNKNPDRCSCFAPFIWVEVDNILLVAGVAFVAFRIFDIIKPFPARRLEKLPYGWGVLLDDLAAGVYANVASQIVLRLGFHLS